jgi:hypothetical protein
MIEALGIGGTMLLEKERERLLAVLQSRTATHVERDRARRTLEGELSLSEWPEDVLASNQRSTSAEESSEQGR